MEAAEDGELLEDRNESIDWSTVTGSIYCLSCCTSSRPSSPECGTFRMKAQSWL